VIGVHSARTRRTPRDAPPDFGYLDHLERVVIFTRVHRSSKILKIQNVFGKIISKLTVGFYNADNSDGKGII